MADGRHEHARERLGSAADDPGSRADTNDFAPACAGVIAEVLEGPPAGGRGPAMQTQGRPRVRGVHCAVNLDVVLRAGVRRRRASRFCVGRAVARLGSIGFGRKTGRDTAEVGDSPSAGGGLRPRQPWVCSPVIRDHARQTPTSSPSDPGSLREKVGVCRAWSRPSLGRVGVSATGSKPPREPPPRSPLRRASAEAPAEASGVLPSVALPRKPPRRPSLRRASAEASRRRTPRSRGSARSASHRARTAAPPTR